MGQLRLCRSHKKDRLWRFAGWHFRLHGGGRGTAWESPSTALSKQVGTGGRPGPVLVCDTPQPPPPPQDTLQAGGQMHG